MLSLDQIDLTPLSAQILSHLPGKMADGHSPINITLILGGGNTLTDNSRNMVGNFSNSSGIFNQGDNNENVQGGKGNIITNNEQVDFEKLIRTLIEEIKANEAMSPEDRDEAIEDTARLEKAVKEGKMDRAKKVFSILSDSVKTLASATSIATYLGIVI